MITISQGSWGISLAGKLYSDTVDLTIGHRKRRLSLEMLEWLSTGGGGGWSELWLELRSIIWQVSSPVPRNRLGGWAVRLSNKSSLPNIKCNLWHHERPHLVNERRPPFMAGPWDRYITTPASHDSENEAHGGIFIRCRPMHPPTMLQGVPIWHSRAPRQH